MIIRFVGLFPPELILIQRNRAETARIPTKLGKRADLDPNPVLKRGSAEFLKDPFQQSFQNQINSTHNVKAQMTHLELMSSVSVADVRYLISNEKLGEINVLFGWIFMNAWFLECIVQIVMATNRILADQAVLSYAFVRIKGVYPYSNWMVLAYDGLCTSISTLCYILVFRSIQKDKQKLTSTAQKRLIKQDIKYLVQFVFISIFYVFTWVLFEILNLIVTDVRIEFWIVVPICVTCNSSTNALIYLTANREVQKLVKKCCEANFFVLLPKLLPGPSCTPKTPRTFLYAYSTDLDFASIQESFAHIATWLGSQPHWNTYASVRLDTETYEDIQYSKDINTFNKTLNLLKPDPSIGYPDSATGSNMFIVIRKFLKNTQFLCGSTIVIAAKRYPNEGDLDDLIADLQKNHVFVYFQASDTPSGGNNPFSMFYVASRTNGYCVFSTDYTFGDLVDNTLWETSVRNLFVAKKFAVSAPSSKSQADGSLKALDYKVTDRFGNILLTGNNFAETKFTAYYSWFFAKDAVDYYFTVNYEYQSGRQETMEVRWFAANYIPPNFLPFNN
ncbi:unnamed protein product [Caenorhabditis brenneri]